MNNPIFSTLFVLALGITSTPTYAQLRSLTRDLEKPMYAPATDQQLARATWNFGWNLSILITLRANDAKVSAMARYRTRCEVSANTLGIRVPTLFRPRGEKIKDFVQAIGFVTKGEAPRLCASISTRHGRRYGAIFEFAMKNGLLLLMYSSKDASGWNRSLLTAIRRSAAAAEIPDRLWRTIRTSVADRDAARTVRRNVFNLDGLMQIHYGSTASAPTTKPSRKLQRRKDKTPLVVQHLVRPFLSSYPSVSVRDESAHSKAFRSIRSSCFKLGLLLGEVSFRMANGDDVTSDVRRIRAVCKTLRVVLPDFKDQRGLRIAGTGRLSRVTGIVNATSYALHVGGPAVARALAGRRGAHVGAAPFELGLKAAVMSRVASASDQAILAKEIQRLGDRSRIPMQKWSALTSLARSKARTTVLTSVSTSIRNWGQ